MFIACYTENGIKKYDVVSDMNDFSQKHPSITTDYLFANNQDISDSERFRSFAGMYGLSASDLMRRFKNFRGESCVLMNIEPRNRKYPIIVYNEDRGKQFKCTAKSVREALDKIS